jgi:hypothetical protein
MIEKRRFLKYYAIPELQSKYCGNAHTPLEMSKVVPVPGPNFCLTGAKIFSEQDQDQNVFLDRDRNQNIFDWNPHPKFVSEGTGTKTLNFFSPGPGPRP